MADKIEIQIDGKNNASPAFKEASTGIGSIVKAAAGLLAAKLSFDALKEGITSCIDAAKESSVVTAQSEAVIKSTGGAAGYSATQFEDMANKLSTVVPMSHDAIQAGENMLATFTNIGQKTFPQATATVVDMTSAFQAAGKKMNISDVAILVGKALNDPVKGISALTRVGVSFTAQQKAQIAAMEKVGNTAGAQAIILGELNREFGGSGAAAGKTFPGQLEILKNSLSMVEAKIGMAIIPIFIKLASIAVPLVVAGVNLISDGVTRVSALLSGPFNTAFTVAHDLIVNKIFPAVSQLAQYLLGPLSTGWGFVTDHAGAFFALLLPQYDILLKFIQAIGKDGLGGALSDLPGIIGTVISQVAGIGATLGSSILHLFDAIDWSAVGSILVTGLGTAFGALKNIASTGINLAGQLFTLIGSQIGSVDWKSVGKILLDGLGTGLSKVAAAGGRAGTLFFTWLFSQVSGVDWTPIGKKLLDSVGTGLATATAAGGRAGTEIYTWLFAQVTGVDWTPIGKNILDGIGSGLAGAGSLASGAASIGVISNILGPIESMLGKLTPLVDAVEAAFAPMWANIQQSAAPIMAQFSILWAALQTSMVKLQPTIDSIQTALVALSPVLGIIKPILEAIGIVIGTVLIGAIGLLLGTLGGLVGMLTGVLPGAIQYLTGVIEVWTGIFQTISAVVVGVVSIIDDLIHGRWRQAWADAQTMVQGVADGIGTIIGGLKDMVVGLITGLVGGVEGLISGFVTSIVSFFQSMYDSLVGHSIIPDLVNAIIGWITTLRDTLSGIWDAISTKASGIWTGIQTLIDTTKDTLKSSLLWPFEQFRDNIGAISTAAGNAFLAPLRGVMSSFGSFVDGVKGAVNWVGGQLKLGDIISGSWSIPQFAGGVQNFPGGYAIVGEKGPELVKFPGGVDVLPANQTQSILNVNRMGPDETAALRYGQARGWTGIGSGLTDVLSGAASVVGDALSTLSDWVGKGASWVTDAAFKATGVGLNLAQPFTAVGSKAFDETKGLVTNYVGSLLGSLKSQVPVASAATGSAGGGGAMVGGNAILDKAYVTQGVYMWCEKFVGDVMSSLGLRYARAADAATHAGMQPLTAGTGPAGAVVFMPWDTSGHVAFSMGNGQLFGTANTASGTGVQAPLAGAAYTVNPAADGLYAKNGPILAMMNERNEGEIAAPIPMLQKVIQDALSSAGQGGSGARPSFGAIASWLIGPAQDLVHGFVQGFSSTASLAVQAAVSLAGSVVSAVTNAWQIHSPSVVATDIATKFNAGITKGLSQTDALIAAANTTATKLATSMITGITNGVSSDTFVPQLTSSFLPSLLAAQKAIQDKLDQAVASGMSAKGIAALQSQLDASTSLIQRWTEQNGMTIQQFADQAAQGLSLTQSQSAITASWTTTFQNISGIVDGTLIPQLTAKIIDLNSQLKIALVNNIPTVVDGIRQQIAAAQLQLDQAGQLYGGALSSGIVQAMANAQAQQAAYGNFSAIVSGTEIPALKKQIDDLVDELSVALGSGAGQVVIDSINQQIATAQLALQQAGAIFGTALSDGIVAWTASSAAQTSAYSNYSAIIAGTAIPALKQQIQDLINERSVAIGAGAGQAVIDGLNAQIQAATAQIQADQQIFTIAAAQGLTTQTLKPLSAATVATLQSLEKTMTDGGASLLDTIVQQVEAGSVTLAQAATLLPKSVIPQLQTLEDQLTVQLAQAFLAGTDPTKIEANIKTIEALLKGLGGVAVAVAKQVNGIGDPNAGSISSQLSAYDKKYGVGSIGMNPDGSFAYLKSGAMMPNQATNLQSGNYSVVGMGGSNPGNIINHVVVNVDGQVIHDSSNAAAEHANAVTISPFGSSN